MTLVNARIGGGPDRSRYTGLVEEALEKKNIMLARVYVTLKPSVFDPQGRTIADALQSLGYESVQDVRQGKYFEITLDSTITPDEARREIERMAKDVLANPVIEDYRVELDSGGEA